MRETLRDRHKQRERERERYRNMEIYIERKRELTPEIFFICRDFDFSVNKLSFFTIPDCQFSRNPRRNVFISEMGEFNKLKNTREM